MKATSDCTNQTHWQAKSMELIRQRTREAVGHSIFEEISKSTLLMIIADDELNITEIELFNAVKRWASKECERTGRENNAAIMRQVTYRYISNVLN